MKNVKNSKLLNLMFPQWQGSGDSKELFYGAQAIKQQLSNIKFLNVNVSLEPKNETQFGIYAFSAVHEQLKNACKIIFSTNPDKILTIGGDCGVEVGPVSFLNQKYLNELTIIWFDAHGDLNIPEESSSHHFHGMPLRTLLGDGNKPLIQSCFSSLSTNQVILSGGRDFDKAEKDFIKSNKIPCFSVPDLENQSDRFFDSIQEKGTKNIYIHIDLDVLDPMHFPEVKCPTPKGVSFEILKTIVSRLTMEFKVVGVGIVEYSLPKRSDLDKNLGKNPGIDKIEDLLKTCNYI